MPLPGDRVYPDAIATELARRPADDRVVSAKLIPSSTDFPARTLGGIFPRVLLFAALITVFLSLFKLQALIWPHGRTPVRLWEWIIWTLTIAWALPALPALTSVLGFALHRKPKSYPNIRLNVLVCFRIVSRGQNSAVLIETIRNIRGQMASTPLFPYQIEVITDLAVDLPSRPDVVHFVVPETYQTPRGSLYKARALQYALDHSSLPDNAWIMHLDEESRLTSSVIVGIQASILEEEASGSYRIGQGAILYYRSLKRNPILALADSIRTGDDLGRFHFQHRLGLPLFGLHGSFILVRHSVERQTGFDFGPVGSVTEDAFWALRQMHLGQRCRWVDGYLIEQAPETIMDFIKQRRRWFVGLGKCFWHSDVKMRFRFVLGLSILLWSLSWIGIQVTYINLFAGQRTPFPIQVAGNFAFATYIVAYLLGLTINLANLDSEFRLSRWQRPGLYLLQIGLIPVFSALESLGVLYGLVRPDSGFHVVQKTEAKKRLGLRWSLFLEPARAAVALAVGLLRAVPFRQNHSSLAADGEFRRPSDDMVIDLARADGD